MLPRSRIAQGSLVVCTLLAIALLAAVAWTEWRRQGDNAPHIGGPYTLTNTAGETVTRDAFLGEYRLIYFGYTHCPGVCPTTLNTMTRAMRHFDERSPELADDVRPVFITIDPERDTPERMAAYLESFHPRFAGLTGTPAQIEKAAEAFKVDYAKKRADAFEEGSTMYEQAQDVGYLMQHASYVFLMDPSGQYVDHLSTNANATQMVRFLREHVSG